MMLNQAKEFGLHYIGKLKSNKTPGRGRLKAFSQGLTLR